MMAGKNWQAGGKDSIPARAALCLVATLIVILAPDANAWAATDDFALPNYVVSADANTIWIILLGGLVIASFLMAIGLWVLSALRKVKRSQLRRNAFISSALNNLNQGVVMTDAERRIIFCNDRYLEIYGLVRADVPRNMTGPELLELRHKRGALDISVEEFYARSSTPEGLITELPDGRSVLVNIFCCRTAARSQPMTIAPSSASCRGSWH